MAQADCPADRDLARGAVLGKYSALARAARSGQQVTDCGADAAPGRYGSAGYEDVSGLPDAAVRASLGCGNPVAVAELSPGESVLDLGSGGGIDVLLSARRVGPSGRAYGLDGSPEMVELARANAASAGAGNVEFLHGHIEDIPLPDGHVDVVISNCVLNLSADKPLALAEACRVLRPGGRLGISDMISAPGADPEQLAEAERLTGCAATVSAAEYREYLLAAGFCEISIRTTQGTGSGVQSAIVQARRPDAPAGVLIRPMRPGDASQVLRIYQDGLDTGDASFETRAPAWDEFDGARLRLHRHVAVDEAGQLLGWVAASAVSGRCVYGGVIEHSVYVRPDTRGRGVGSALLDALTGSTESAGIWTIQTGIFPENAASLRLHERAGFRVVGTRSRLGCHRGRWRDVILLERRSAVAGIS